MDPIRRAGQVLSENARVPYGIFGSVARAGVFPPRAFLNEFLAQGEDPCDQDARMRPWTPFALDEAAYRAVKQRWIAAHPGTV